MQFNSKQKFEYFFNSAPADCPDVSEVYTKLIDGLKTMGDKILTPKFIEDANTIHEKFPCILTIQLLERIVSNLSILYLKNLEFLMHLVDFFSKLIRNK